MKDIFLEFDFNEGKDFEIDKINGIKLPKDYVEFMREHNGVEGDIGNVWVDLERLEELEDANKDFEEDERFENAVFIGSNGSGEWFGIDSEGNYFTAPSIGSEEDIIILGKTIDDFFKNLNEKFKYLLLADISDKQRKLDYE